MRTAASVIEKYIAAYAYTRQREYIHPVVSEVQSNRLYDQEKYTPLTNGRKRRVWTEL